MPWARLVDSVMFLLAYAAVVTGYFLFISGQRGNSSTRQKAYAATTFLGISALWVAWALHQAKFGFNIGWDFTQFYVAANLPISHLFDRSAFVAFGESRLAPIGILYYPPYVRPALFAFAFKPLAGFSYWHAYWIFAASVFLAYATAIYILFRWLQLPIALLPAFAVFFPAAFGTIIGQDACAYALMLLTAIVLSSQGRDKAAGLLFGLCTYKFHLLLLIPFVLLFKARWRTLLTFAVVGITLFTLSFTIAPLSEYLQTIRMAPSYGIGFTPGGLHGVLVILNHETWYYPLAFAGLAACAYLIWRLPFVDAYSVAITGALVFAYYANWYDYSLLVIPVCVLWHRATKVARAILLALLLYPPAWSRGEQFFQATAGFVILIQFAIVSWKRRGTLDVHGGLSIHCAVTE
jgi:glycosyl transferase family 87